MKNFLVEYKRGIETFYEVITTNDYYYSNHDVAIDFIRTHDKNDKIVRIWIDSGAY